MSDKSVNVSISGAEKEYLDQQVSPKGSYSDADEYIRELIRKDKKSREEALDWLWDELTPGLLADDSEFIEVSAEDVIARNRERHGL